MSGPHRNPDRVNSIGIVVIGICGAVLVYVSIVALQAFYMGDTSEVQMMADYGGQDIGARTIRAEQINAINTTGPNPAGTFRIPIEHAMELVVADAKRDPGDLVPTQGRADKRTIEPSFGRPKLAAPAAPPASGSAAAPADAGSAAAGSAAGVDGGSAALQTPTGGMGPGGGAPTGAGPTPGPNPGPAAPAPTAPAPSPTPAAGSGSAAR